MSMKNKRGLLVKSAVAVSVIALSLGLVAPANATNLTGNGSSAVKNLLDACIPVWSKWSSHNLSYPGGGSGSGRSGLLAGTVDLAFSDTPYSATEAKPAHFVYIPASIFPVSVFANLPGFKGTLNLSPSTIANIYAGKITKWNDPAIVADNTVVNAKTKKKVVTALPNLDITVYYRFDRSGTSEIFTDWLNQTNPTVWTKAKSGTFTSAFPGTTVPAGTFQSGNQSDGVANGVASKAGAIGYGEVSYATERKMVVARVKNNSGEFIAPTSTAASIFANGYVAGTTPGVITLDYTKKIKSSYSLTGFAYGLAYTEAANKNIGTQAVVKQFMDYVVNDCATEQAAKLGYAKLSGSLLELAEKQIALIK
jgi:phosphate transport system substrate-binding protein